MFFLFINKYFIWIFNRLTWIYPRNNISRNNINIGSPHHMMMEVVLLQKTERGFTVCRKLEISVKSYLSIFNKKLPYFFKYKKQWRKTKLRHTSFCVFKAKLLLFSYTIPFGFLTIYVNFLGLKVHIHTRARVCTHARTHSRRDKTQYCSDYPNICCQYWISVVYMT